MAYQIPSSDEVYLITGWSAKDDKNMMDKTKTSILLNKNKEFVAFGTNAHTKYRVLRKKTMSDKKVEHLFFERFKMALYGQLLLDINKVYSLSFRK